MRISVVVFRELSRLLDRFRENVPRFSGAFSNFGPARLFEQQERERVLGSEVKLSFQNLQKKTGMDGFGVPGCW